MLERRREKFERVAAKRQKDITVILENIHDLHNLGAVLRSCDAVGIHEIYLLQTDPNLQQDNQKLGRRTSSGARRWVDVHYFTTPKACFEQVKRKYDKIYSTSLSQDAHSIFELDLTQSVALLFGNEHNGLTTETAAYSDGNFIIPQVGMVESLNISVACAVSVYEAFRQRSLKGFYTTDLQRTKHEQAELYQEFVRRDMYKEQRIDVKPLD